jgi:hypothetical protein
LDSGALFFLKNYFLAQKFFGTKEGQLFRAAP